MIKQMAWDNELFLSNRLRARAAIDKNSSYFEQILGIKFHEGLDDLDYYKGLMLGMNGDTVAALVMYRQNPHTVLYLPYDRPQPEFISNAIRQILERFDLSEDHVIWRDAP